VSISFRANSHLFSIQFIRTHFQVKVMTDKELLATACEQFLGKSVEDIKNVLLQTLEGHLRAILGMFSNLA